MAKTFSFDEKKHEEKISLKTYYILFHLILDYESNAIIIQIS